MAAFGCPPRLEIRIRQEDLIDILRSHLAKYRSLMPSLALLLQIAEEETGYQIPFHRACRAIQWCEYLESHARRIYSCVTGAPNPSATLLAHRLKAGALGTRFSIRDLSQRDWSGLDTPELARSAVKALEDAGWVRRVPYEPTEKGGRPSEIYEMNPKIFRR